MRQAHIELPAIVYVSDDELATACGLEGTEDKLAKERLEEIDPVKLEDTFQAIAYAKIRELVPTDHPLKFESIEISPSTHV